LNDHVFRKGVRINTYKLASEIWYADTELEITFPENWSVQVCDMAGADAPILSDDAIRKRIDNPIDCEPIRKGARGSKSAVVIFDDLTRPTPVWRLAPHVLESLMEAGVPKHSIRFVMATGAHRAHTRCDYVKKLGKEIVDEYPVFNHNPFQNCKRIGITRFGTPVEINAEVMSCDYKIGIGGIVPHFQMGYGGGSKIIVPGVASIETIRKNHYLSFDPAEGLLKAGAGFGNYSSNKHRLDAEEAGQLAGLDFKIDAFFNYKGNITNLFAGHPIYEYQQAVKKAKGYYRTEKARDMDVVIANAYCKATEAGVAIPAGLGSLKESGGDYIVVTNSPEGLAPHYLYGRWGLSRVGGWDWSEKRSLPERIRRMIIFSKYIDRGGNWWFAPSNKVNWISEWSKVIELIGKEEKLVALYPDATIQLIK